MNHHCNKMANIIREVLQVQWALTQSPVRNSATAPPPTPVVFYGHLLLGINQPMNTRRTEWVHWSGIVSGPDWAQNGRTSWVESELKERKRDNRGAPPPWKVKHLDAPPWWWAAVFAQWSFFRLVHLKYIFPSQLWVFAFLPIWHDWQLNLWNFLALLLDGEEERTTRCPSFFSGPRGRLSAVSWHYPIRNWTSLNFERFSSDLLWKICN